MNNTSRVHKKSKNICSSLSLMSILNSNKQIIPKDKNKKSKASGLSIIADSNRKT